MEKKTKVLVAAIAGALTIGLALSVGSCVSRSLGPAVPSNQEASQQQSDAGNPAASSTQTAFQRACSKDWRSDKGFLQLSKGMLIEKDAEGGLHVLTISSVDEADGGKQTLITVVGNDEEDHKAVTWVIVLDESNGVASLSCDGFKVSKSYSENVGSGAVSVSGLDEAYIGLVGGDVDPLREALGAYISKNVPQAASASFDGEAFIDFNKRSVSATFHADDSARTILTVTYANGSFSVSG